jgi:hypothetical protein
MNNTVKKPRKLRINKLFSKLILLDTFFAKSTSENTFLSLRELIQLKIRLDKYSLGIYLADMKAVCLFKFKDSPEVIEGYFKREGKIIAGIYGVKLVDSLLDNNLNEEVFKNLVESCMGSRQVKDLDEDLDTKKFDYKIDLVEDIQVNGMGENKNIKINFDEQ